MKEILQIHLALAILLLMISLGCQSSKSSPPERELEVVTLPELNATHDEGIWQLSANGVDRIAFQKSTKMVKLQVAINNSTDDAMPSVLFLEFSDGDISLGSMALQADEKEPRFYSFDVKLPSDVSQSELRMYFMAEMEGSVSFQCDQEDG